MNSSTLQQWIDELQETSAQQWAFVVTAVVSATGAVLAATAANEGWWPIGLVLVFGLALASAVRSDNNTALLAIGVIIWHWLATVDDVSTPWLPVAGGCLLLYHSVISLSASVPPGGNVASDLLAQWAARIGLGIVATVAVWLVVTVFDRGDTAGNGLVTGIALAVATAGALMIRTRSINHP